MTLTCPQGHSSGDEEYCDVCGTPMPQPLATSGPSPGPGGSTGSSGSSGMPAPSGTGSSGTAGSSSGTAGSSGMSGSGGAGSSGSSAGPDAAVNVCPICQTPRSGRFCEVDGHDFEAPPLDPVAPALWEAVVEADRAYYDEIIAQDGPDAGAVVFPPYCPERSFPLVGPQVRIGRSSRSRNSYAEIDLGRPPADPGISHLHAVLMAQRDGTWTLVDPGSANGTMVNGKALQVNVPVQVREGDRIHLGAWTVITLRESAP
ncbi:FHA domain-containing protein [Nonomuraea dietziae]|uniref:FHA domain-containing protein n=1 Tax=Nonomuraea dietziae TaxID=65515 RepID=UPI003407BFF6